MQDEIYLDPKRSSYDREQIRCAGCGKKTPRFKFYYQSRNDRHQSALCDKCRDGNFIDSDFSSSYVQFNNVDETNGRKYIEWMENRKDHKDVDMGGSCGYDNIHTVI